MNDPHWFEIIGGAVMAGMAWLFKRHVNRVDELERTCVKKADFDDLADTTRAEVTALREHMDNKFEAQTQRIFEMLRDRR